MSIGTGSAPRSFRLSRTTNDLLDQKAAQAHQSGNSLADRILGEGLRTEDHPLVRFRSGAAGRREPILVGTRLLVRQVVATLWVHDGNPKEAAEYLGVSTSTVTAALSYYADFTEEVNADIDWAESIETAERARWEKEQSLASR